MQAKRFSNSIEKGLCIIAGSFGAIALGLVLSDDAYAFESAKVAIEELCGHMQGSLGALLMSAAAVGAIVAAAFGNFRASFSFLITGIGAFTVSTMLSLYFPTAAESCNNGGGGNGNGNNAAPVLRTVNPAAVAQDTDDAGVF